MLSLVAISAASFTSGLTRQLRLPQQDNTATVVVVAPREPPLAAPIIQAQASLTRPQPAAARPPAKPRRRPTPRLEAAEDLASPVITPAAAIEEGVDAAATTTPSAPLEATTPTPTP